jgi:hypothetical protein
MKMAQSWHKYCAADFMESQLSMNEKFQRSNRATTNPRENRRRTKAKAGAEETVVKVQHLRRRQDHGGHDQDVCKARMVPLKDTGGREHPIDHMSTVLEEAHLQRVIAVQGYARGWKNTPRSLREPS